MSVEARGCYLCVYHLRDLSHPRILPLRVFGNNMLIEGTWLNVAIASHGQEYRMLNILFCMQIFNVGDVVSAHTGVRFVNL